MCDTEKSLAEQELESEQRAYELGQRYGLLDARAGRPEDMVSAAQIGLDGKQAELYAKGHKERYDAWIAKLETYGTVLSVPATIPGDRASATATGHTRVDNGMMMVQVQHPGDAGTTWYPVEQVMVIR